MDRRSMMGKLGGYRSAASQADMRALYCEQQGDDLGALVWRAKADLWRKKWKMWQERIDALEEEPEGE